MGTVFILLVYAIVYIGKILIEHLFLEDPPGKQRISGRCQAVLEMPKVNSGRLPISHSRLRITISATRVKKRNRGASRSKKSFIGYHLVYFWSTKAS